MNYQKISVVIHCFNREDLVSETIESVLSQNYPNLELIVIDDASTDKSWEVIQKYKDRISYMERLTGKRDSPVEALNVGFSHATGEIMCWLNTKNTFLPRNLFVVNDVFEKLKQVRWLTGLGSMIDDNGNILRIRLFRKNIYDYVNNDWETIQQESTFWRKDLWQETGSEMNPQHKWSFDAALWAKFFQKAELYHLNTVLGTYRQTAQSMSINRRAEFLSNTKHVLDDFRSKISRKIAIDSKIYQIIRLIRPILRMIPDRIFSKIPILKKYCYNCISYHLIDGKWEPIPRKKNPFDHKLQ